MRTVAPLFAALASATALLLLPARAEVIELNAGEIFDGGLFMDADVEIVNGRVVVKTADSKEEKKAEPDPAGDQVLELTDGSQLHGKLVALGKSEIVWQRADATQPLTFTPQEVRRLILGTTVALKDAKANATLKLHGTDWLAGDLTELKDGKFHVSLGEAAKLEIERSRVEWLALSPAGTPPPDAYEGPLGPMGLAGWESAAETNGAWDYADGALVAKTATALTRSFEVLPERVDIQFTAGDGGSGNRGLVFVIQSGKIRNSTNGTWYLQFQGNNVNANIYTGDSSKRLTAEIPVEKEEKKLTRYRLFLDRKDGRLVVQVNGKQIADWDVQETKQPSVGAMLSWQPSYWSSNMAWTLANIRVQPWDGTLPADQKSEEAGKDQLVAGAAARKTGALEGIAAGAITFGGVEVPRKEPLFVRLAPPATVEPPPSAIARVWLAARGEFDVTGIGFKDGQLKTRTAFAGDLTLPIAAIRAIEFPHKIGVTDKTVAEGGDLLIFKNGDQLRGTLVGAGHDQPLRWKPVKGDKPVEFGIERLAGVLLAPRGKPDEPAPSAGSAAVRFHNGDWLPGDLLALDGEHLHLKTALSTDLQIARRSVRTLYFGPSGEAPVWDGASGRELWMKGTAVPGYWDGNTNIRKKDDKKPSPWRYLDGSFTLLNTSGGRGGGNSPNLGRSFDALPDKVDVSFELSTTKGPAGYAIMLFFDENKAGLMIQGGWDSAYIYDMSPRRQAAGFFNQQQQQIDFGDKVGSEGTRRHFRFLGDRRTGRLWMLVNDRLVGTLGKRGGGGQNSDNPKPGKGVAIVPQPMMTRATVSNIWIAPWSGAIPSQPKEDKEKKKEEAAPAEAPPGAAKPAADGKEAPAAADKPAAPPAAEPEPEPPLAQDAVALTNGDETFGTLLRATIDELTLRCDVGELQIPLKRALLVDLAGPPEAQKGGIRLRFAGKGALTVESMRLEGGQVICRSAAAGELTFPLTALAEIIFPTNSAGPFENLPVKAANPPAVPALPAAPLLLRQRLIIPGLLGR